MARPCDILRAVQNVLNTQVDIIASAVAGDFDPVREGGQGGVRPARPAVLGDVLVELVGQAALPVDVVPIPLPGQILIGDVTIEVGAGSNRHERHGLEFRTEGKVSELIWPPITSSSPHRRRAPLSSSLLRRPLATHRNIINISITHVCGRGLVTWLFLVWPSSITSSFIRLNSPAALAAEIVVAAMMVKNFIVVRL